MQRVYGELIINGTTTDNVVDVIKEHEIALDLNPVPEKFVLRKLGIKVDKNCTIKVNGHDFVVHGGEALEFGYDCIRAESVIFDTAVNAVIRYMYFREDKVYQ